jgi:hypothetical protein
MSTRTGFGFLPALSVIGLSIILMGLVLAPERTWPNVLLAAIYIVGTALAAMLFLAFNYVASARWNTVLKRVAESLASTLPLGAALVLLSLAGIGVLYEWSHADVVAADPLLQAKAGWLNVSFFVMRAVFYLAVWLLFLRLMLRASRSQDSAGGLAAHRRSTVISACFIVASIVTFSLAIFDWLMSLQPHWFSTMFAVYNFVGAFVSGLAMIMLLAILLRRPGGPLAGIVTSEHLHDLGKLLLGFSTFWMYIWYCQYMLIWYSNLPEEVTFYVGRHAGAWGVLSVTNLIVNWVIPFFVLLPRGSKRRDSTLLRVCVLLLVGRWLDLYVMIQPVFEPDAPRFGIWEIAPIVVAGALFAVVLRRNLETTDLVPRDDPHFEESLRHHQ